MHLTPIVGGVAALCSTVSFTPQALKIIRTRETKDISVGMYLLTVAGFIAWTAYGALLMQWPLILANGICLLLSAFILTMKILPRGAKNAVAEQLAPD
ncbi:MAG TPA: SemiSWEET transporter [Rhizomicrobium sp.]|jgi:MtN3 and saliva related transmembrane protein|nr:SemiSWEET transporter [Rhizomicrobium sp.]